MTHFCIWIIKVSIQMHTLLETVASVISSYPLESCFWETAGNSTSNMNKYIRQRGVLKVLEVHFY